LVQALSASGNLTRKHHALKPGCPCNYSTAGACLRPRPRRDLYMVEVTGPESPVAVHQAAR